MTRVDEAYRAERIKEVEGFVLKHLKNIASEEYARTIYEKVGKDIVDDIICSSGFDEDGDWNDDDVRLSVGRILVEALCDKEVAV